MAERADVLFGNLAYDPFNGTAVREPVPEYAPPKPREEPAAERPAVERPAEKVRVRPERAPARRQYVSVLAVIGSLCTAAALVMVLFSYIRLNAVSHESVRLQREIEQLQEENKRLRISYESAFKLEEVEKYAVSELGMVKAETGQVMYINNSQADRAAILGDPDAGGPAAGIARFFRRLTEYLR
ncbi:MAG: septum formation initiator family protein [Oscillospiraceae bacterium]|nr:septum formation initiator family protein [Oscillospiraceae bacterium]